MKQLVEIHWDDSIGVASWRDPDCLRDSSMVQRSVGWLVGETDDAYIVSSTIGEGHDDDDAYAPLKIPKSSILGFWYIEL